MTFRMLFVGFDLLSLSCSKKENVGVIIRLHDEPQRITSSAITRLGSAEIWWVTDDKEVHHELLFPGQDKQVVVPEETRLNADITYFVMDIQSKATRDEKRSKDFIAVKNNPYWDLP